MACNGLDCPQRSHLPALHVSDRNMSLWNANLFCSGSADKGADNVERIIRELTHSGRQGQPRKAKKVSPILLYLEGGRRDH